MSRRWIAACALLLAACAQNPGMQDGSTAYNPQTSPATEAQRGARAHMELGAAYYARGQLGIALEELQEALKSDPNYGPAYNVLGLVYMELRDDPVARQYFERALAINPGDPDAHNNFGSFLCQRGQYDEGIKHYLQAIRNPLYPTPHQSYVNAGVCSLRKGDRVAAEDYFLKAIRLVPVDAVALVNLGELSFRKGDFQDARTYMQRYMQAVTNPSAEALWLGVRTERQLADRRAEESYSTQLQRRFPDSAEAKLLQQGKYE